MADPYAERGEAQAADRPAAASPFAGLIAELGGRPLLAASEAAAREAAAREADDPRFLALPRHDEGLLPPLARLTPELAVALLPAESPAESERALATLRERRCPLLLVKDGLIAGPPGSEGCAPVPGELVEALLRAAIEDGLAWERDPDFGWEIPLEAPRQPGEADAAAELLCPRLVYAASDRVYEHAELVAATKRRWHETLAPGAPAALAAAVGWPPQPTGTAWKD
jgi:hypothetical protein